MIPNPTYGDGLLIDTVTCLFADTISDQLEWSLMLLSFQNQSSSSKTVKDSVL